MSDSSVQAQRALRHALGSFSTGVTVITTQGELGQPLIGLTVNSFSSVSLEPPLVLWSLSNRSTNMAHFAVGREHAIHVLSEDQEGVARQFASPQADRCAGIDYQPPGDFGAPLIEGCCARFYCVTESVLPAGDHQIILARVLRYETTPAAAPLLFVRGGFATAAMPVLASATA